MVISWTEGESKSLDLLVVPRKGLTTELLRHANIETAGSSRLVMFSGPHGLVVPVEDYESVLMVASGSGIAAQLPYLEQLVHQHNNHKARTRKIHLIWCLKSNSRPFPTFPSLCTPCLTSHRYRSYGRATDPAGLGNRYAWLRKSLTAYALPANRSTDSQCFNLS